LELSIYIKAATRPEIKILASLKSAFARETMAHIKYRYFAKLALLKKNTIKTYLCIDCSVAKADFEAAAI
jgi:rubrerythrin